MTRAAWQKSNMYDSPEKKYFGHVTDWVFDLDNTLYPRSVDLFSQIDKRMTAYVARLTGLETGEARKLQKQLYKTHGTTLAGLMDDYAIDPKHYLADVHDIDYSVIDPHPELGEAILQLPGRKHIFTNGDLAHAENTLSALGITGHFDAMFDIVCAGFEPKPLQIAYDRFFDSHGVNPEQSVMFEDLPRNLEVPKKVGMATVLVVPANGSDHGSEAWETAGHDEPHIDHVTDDLAGFLEQISAAFTGTMDGESKNPA